MGAFYIEEIGDDDNLSVEDENNKFLEDPETIDLTKEDTNLEAMGIKKVNGKTHWNDLVEESSQRYVATIRQEPPKIKIVSVRGGNGEEHAGETCSPDDGMFAAMPGGKNHVTTDAADQSKRTAVGGETTRERQQPMSRKRTTTVADNVETCDAQETLTSEGRYEANEKMEREESRLLRIYREKLRKREKKEARRASRIEHLKYLIDNIPDVEEIPDDEDHRIEEEIDEVERIYNALDESKTIFRIMKEVCDRDEREVAKFYATVNLKTDPTRMRADKQGIMAIVIIKNREMRVETKLLGDIDLNNLGNLQIKMSGIDPIRLSENIEKRRGTEIAIPKTVTRDDTTNVPMVRGETPVTTQPEETTVPCPDTIEQEITIQTEGERENITPRTSTPRTSTSQAYPEEEEKRSRKRTHSSKRKRYTYSDSSEESTSEEEAREKRKMVRKTSSRKKPEEEKEMKKTRAKDGRKLVDLSNRIRDEKGRILGYKPGTQPAKIQIKKKKDSEGITKGERANTRDTTK